MEKESIQTYSVNLNDRELSLLDGSCSEKSQITVDAAMLRLETQARLSHLTHRQAAFVADLVSTARVDGKLTFCPSRLRHCKVCNVFSGYAKYARSSRNHRKGDSNYGKPLTLSGYDFSAGFVRMSGYPSLGCCHACLKTVEVDALQALDGIEAQLPERWTGRPTKFVCHDNRKCSACGWVGHEGEMGHIQTLMGNGTYPAGCPGCSAKNVLFGEMIIKSVDGRTVVKV